MKGDKEERRVWGEYEDEVRRKRSLEDRTDIIYQQKL